MTFICFSKNFDICILLVPGASPTLNAFTNDSATNFRVNWSPPPPQSQNGVITIYTINITGDPLPFTGSPLSYTTDGSYPSVTDLFLEIGLEEYNEYTVSIAAVNSAGIGPYTTRDIQRTNGAGKNHYVCTHCTVAALAHY